MENHFLNKYFLVILCGVALIAFSCKQQCNIDINKPTDINPIDWENYRYYSRFSSHLGGNNEIWFYLRDEQKREFSDIQWPDHNAIEISFYPDISINKEELLEKFDTWTSIKKRIYIKGALSGGAGGPPRCPDSIYPIIILKSLDDIFESDKNDDE